MSLPSADSRNAHLVASPNSYIPQPVHTSSEPRLIPTIRVIPPTPTDPNANIPLTPQNHPPAQPQTPFESNIQAREALREEWIRTSSAQIAHLTRVSFLRAQIYSRTHSEDDLRAWHEATSQLASVTSLDARIGERRNMFLPTGMQAMRTGVPGDGMAGNTPNDELSAGGDEGTGRWLGYRMAVMERVCAEVRREGDRGVEEEVVGEMSAEERRALRQTMIARVEAATARRMASRRGTQE